MWSSFADVELLGKTWTLRAEAQREGDRKTCGRVCDTSRGRLIFQLHDKRIASQEIIDFGPKCRSIIANDTWSSSWTKCYPIPRKRQRRILKARTGFMFSIFPITLQTGNLDEKVYSHLKHQELKGHQARTKKRTQRPDVKEACRHVA